MDLFRLHKDKTALFNYKQRFRNPGWIWDHIRGDVTFTRYAKCSLETKQQRLALMKKHKDAFMHEPEWAYKYAIITRERLSPEGEQVILQIPLNAWVYWGLVVAKEDPAWPEGEAVLRNYRPNDYDAEVARHIERNERLHQAINRG